MSFFITTAVYAAAMEAELGGVSWGRLIGCVRKSNLVIHLISIIGCVTKPCYYQYMDY